MFYDKQQLGSTTTKGSFDNEKTIIAKFNDYKNDNHAKAWLAIMGYHADNILSLNTTQIPTRLNKNKATQFGISSEQFDVTQKYKKADLQIQLTIKVDDIIYRDNISLKKADLTANFNQIDKRTVSTYQQMWGFDDDITKTLKQFTGEIISTKREQALLKDKRRWYLTKLPSGDTRAYLPLITFYKIR